MPELLLELFSEEIPARMQPAAIEQFERRITEGMAGARLEYGEVRAYVTPRRLALHVRDVPEKQPDQTIERKGPKVSAPEKAVEGFCRSTGLAREQLEIREAGKDQVYMAVIEEQGRPAEDALKDIIETALSQFHWPKSMRWGSHDLQWVRPLRSMVCMLGDAVIPVRRGHLRASNVTYGHRFMSPDAIELHEPASYEVALHEAHVMADWTSRRSSIARQASKLADEAGLYLKEDARLIDEITGLVEWPVALLGRFEDAYLRLPPEVLVLEMRHHQKYLALLDETGAVSNRFIMVANVASDDDGAQIVAGNERVLKARLEDGLFYWHQDRNVPLENWAERLGTMVFHNKLGSMADKVARITPLAETLAVFVPHATLSHVTRAATLAKADLVTGMVGEFPELQGMMGCYYANEQGEPEEVAEAIREHYKPVGRDDDLPQGAVSVAVALADRFDSLCGLCAAGDMPTGSKDPYALRRSALGIIRILRRHHLRMPLSWVLPKAANAFKDVQPSAETVTQLRRFMLERLAVALREEGMRHDVVEAVLADGDDDDIVRIAARSKALQSFLDGDEGVALTGACKRASNIVRKEEQKDSTTYGGDYDTEHLQQPEERALADALRHIRPQVKKALNNEAFAEALHHLATLQPTLDAFFDHVIVNAEEASARVNRLRLLVAVRETLCRVADLSRLEG